MLYIYIFVGINNSSLLNKMSRNKVIDGNTKKRKSKTNGGSSFLFDNGTRSEDTIQENLRQQRFKVKKSDDFSLYKFFFGGKLLKKLIFGSLCAIILAVIAAMIFNRLSFWHKVKRITTQNNLPKVINKDFGDRSHELFWGTYRPGVYFGIKHRTPKSLYFGVIWAVQDPHNLRFHHNCDSNDGVLR